VTLTDTVVTAVWGVVSARSINFRPPRTDFHTCNTIDDTH